MIAGNEPKPYRLTMS